MLLPWEVLAMPAILSSLALVTVRVVTDLALAGVGFSLATPLRTCHEPPRYLYFCTNFFTSFRSPQLFVSIGTHFFALQSYYIVHLVDIYILLSFDEASARDLFTVLQTLCIVCIVCIVFIPSTSRRSIRLGKSAKLVSYSLLGSSGQSGQLYRPAPRFYSCLLRIAILLCSPFANFGASNTSLASFPRGSSASVKSVIQQHN